MKHILATACFLLGIFSLKAQTPVGTWSDHLVYSTSGNIAVSDGEVFSSTGSSILVYNKEYAELKKLSKVNGLSETGISSIAWSKENKTLIIAYSSTNIDLVNANRIYNIPDINLKYIPGVKRINRIRTNGKYAYLLSSFGIVVIDLTKKEIYDTWKPGQGSAENEVWDITFMGDKIYAATESGFYTASVLNQGLSYFGNWSLVTGMPLPSSKFNSVISTGNRVYVSHPDASGSVIYAIDNSVSVFLNEPGVHVNSMDVANTGSGFTVSSKEKIRYYNSEGALQNIITGYGWGTSDIAQAIADNGNIWIADKRSGLISGKGLTVFSKLILPGPVSNDVFAVSSYNGKTLIAAGGVSSGWTGLNKPFQVSVFQDNAWSAYSSAQVMDAMNAIVDPSDNGHVFISSWGGGLLEYRGSNLINLYSYQNSPLQTAIPGQPAVRVSGMAFDRNGLLWITQSNVSNKIKVLKPDGSWINNPVIIDAPVLGNIVITSTGKKWIIQPKNYGIFIFDDNGTPEIFTDDRKKVLTIKDTENNIISSAFCIAEDLDGRVWIGTDQGPLIYSDPDRVFEDDIKASRIKTPRNDGTDLADIVLVTETIRTISIDGANRKWLGTDNSGAYLLSADGVVLIKHFSEENSPLLSNKIVSLSVDNKTGDVWLGTSKGVVSYRSNATEGTEKFSKVYTFPNPVREDFQGNVTITGLMRETSIRITDVSGNLVYETTSDGGEATWDLSTYNGKRVSTGVYLIFCASSDGTQATVTKMLVIR